MRKIRGKTVIVLLVSILLVSPAFIRMNIAQPGTTTIYVDPASLTETVCTEFTVDINVENVANLWAFEFWLSYDTNLLDGLNIALGPFLNKPNHIISQIIDDVDGWLMLAATSDQPALPANGGGTLGTVTFHCTGPGLTVLHLYSTALWDPSMNFIQHETADGMVIQEAVLPWYVKPSYPDYAVSGMPDFDQKQDQWMAPMSGWTWCGSVSVANSLWWLDSEYESIVNPTPVPPPAISDHYKLVTSYNPQQWDDHDKENVGPLVSNLAFLMDTDGQRTLNPATAHSGTYFKDMQVGISQYLAQQGLNPLGDCDGDGDVDYNDVAIVTKAFNSAPGSPNWNMAADFVRPYNDVSVLEMIALAGSLGKVGSFYEHTEEFPAFPWMEDEVYACEDVVLLLEFWQFDGVNWTRYTGGYDLPGGQGGHYVTVAGVNSTTSELLISDPFFDAFEAGKVPGSSPVPHGYPHTSDVHNDTQYVSHDAYPAMLAALSPYNETVFELPTYLLAEGFDPSWHTFIRAAVVTSPQTIVVTDAWTSKDRCAPMPTIVQNMSTPINATVVNQGTTTQTVNVTAYANSTVLGSIVVNNLAPGASVNVTVAKWNTTKWSYGDYYLTVGTNASYQAWTGIPVRVIIQGDVNGDGMVDIYDAVKLATSFGYGQGDPRYNPNADLNCDEVVDIYDAVRLAGAFGKQQSYDP